VDKVALGKVFSEYFGFPCQFPFHTHHLPLAAGTVGQIVADVPRGLTPPTPRNYCFPNPGVGGGVTASSTSVD
jgi:hypothetical protein